MTFALKITSSKKNEVVDRVKTEFKPFFDSMKDLMLKNNEMVGEC